MAKRKLKIGDKVRIIGDNHCPSHRTLGQIGTVRETENGGYRSITVEFPSDSHYNFCYFGTEHLELYGNALQRLKKRYDKTKR